MRMCGKNPSCVIRLDRVQLVSWAVPSRKPPLLPGFKVIKDTFVRSQTTIQTYARCRRYVSSRNGTQIYWQYRRQKGWLKPWKITLVADDRYGLSLQELEQVTKRCRRYRFLLIELAMDFSPSSGITPQFVRRHAVFGKSQRHA